MIYRQSIYLKDGRECLLRHPTSKDAESILRHLVMTSAETDFMLRYPDEIKMTQEMEERYLAKVEKDHRSLMICAVVDGVIVANGGIDPVGNCDRGKHRAVFGVSIQKAYWGLGIGSAITQALVDKAKEMGYEQLELEVVASNERGLALYKKIGFEVYGLRKKSFKYRDGHYEDEYLMSLNL
ncbi:GNAT family N-acetyltransferase [Beduini massiliensis]|uniref:GNAT family N-acetyltransferase n=1 Tax=Beduini massiliensis TaxID=1585974 RepID=UPI00059AA2AB|nr:GNAT family N-acetyltransferase [Beduini massiliensis]